MAFLRYEYQCLKCAVLLTDLIAWPVLAGDLGLIFLTALCDMVMNSALLVCVALTSPLFAGYVAVCGLCAMAHCGPCV